MFNFANGAPRSVHFQLTAIEASLRRNLPHDVRLALFAASTPQGVKECFHGGACSTEERCIVFFAFLHRSLPLVGDGGVGGRRPYVHIYLTVDAHVCQIEG